MRSAHQRRHRYRITITQYHQGTPWLPGERFKAEGTYIIDARSKPEAVLIAKKRHGALARKEQIMKEKVVRVRQRELTEFEEEVPPHIYRDIGRPWQSPVLPSDLAASRRR